jgi:hypothetical protein
MARPRKLQLTLALLKPDIMLHSVRVKVKSNKWKDWWIILE